MLYDLLFGCLALVARDLDLCRPRKTLHAFLVTPYFFMIDAGRPVNILTRFYFQTVDHCFQ